VNYAPELTGVGKYTGEMAEWLVEQGHEVRVVTAPPYYPDWHVSKGYGNTYRRENMEGVGVYRCPLYVPRQPSGLKRLIHLASFALTSLPIMLKQVFWKPDVVMVIEPPLFCAPTALFVAKLSGAKSWLHVQDFEVDAAFDLGIIPFAWMKKSVLSIERWLMKRFDKVSSISQSMVQRLQKKGVDAPVFFPNWADVSKIKFDQQGSESFRQRYSFTPEQCICLYSGNIAVKQGLEIILDVAKVLPEHQFIICGEGASKKKLQAKAKGLDNILFLPLKPLTKFSAMLSAADIHLVIQKAGAADLVLPSKLTNILATGGAAIVTAEEDTELGQLALGEKACVHRSEPEDVESLVHAIHSLCENKQLLCQLRTNAKTYAHEHIASDKVLKAFESKLKEVVN